MTSGIVTVNGVKIYLKIYNLHASDVGLMVVILAIDYAGRYLTGFCSSIN